MLQCAADPVRCDGHERTLKPRPEPFHHCLIFVTYHVWYQTAETDMDPTQTTVQRKEDIEILLAHNLAPITDNVEALIELGFTPSFSGSPTGCEDAIWERPIDGGQRSTKFGLRRVMIRQRAFARNVLRT